MESDFRIDDIYVDEELGVAFAKCYDNVYREEFDKYLGEIGDEEARVNANTLLNDSSFTMSDEIRDKLITTFDINEIDEEELEDEQVTPEEDIPEDETIEYDAEENTGLTTESYKSKTFNIRESLNKMDLMTDNKYDLLNLYESCNLSESEKRELGTLLYHQTNPKKVYDTLNDRFIKEFFQGEDTDIDELINLGGGYDNITELFRDIVDTHPGVDLDFVLETFTTMNDNLTEEQWLTVLEYLGLMDDLDYNSDEDETHLSEDCMDVINTYKVTFYLPYFDDGFGDDMMYSSTKVEASSEEGARKLANAYQKRMQRSVNGVSWENSEIQSVEQVV